MPNLSQLFDKSVDISDADFLKKIPAKQGVLLIADEKQNCIQMITAANMRSRINNRLTETCDQADSQEESVNTNKISRRADIRKIARLVFYHQTTSAFETELFYISTAYKLWANSFKQHLDLKQIWFVTIDISAKFPHFYKTKNFDPSLPAIGPFSSASTADKFIDALADSFDLCRSISCLRQAPNGTKCSYAQMNRCLSPSDGSISMDDYRLVLGRALDFASGNRKPLHISLTEKMKSLAADLDFEQAAIFKARLDRLKDFDLPAFEFAVPVNEFRYLLIQPGVGKRQCKAFAVRDFDIQFIGAFDFPDAEIGDKICKQAALFFQHDKKSHIPNQLELINISLVNKYLRISKANKGLIVKYNSELTSEKLAKLINENRSLLKLSEVVKSAKK